MNDVARSDDFNVQHEHLNHLSDDDLHATFWRLVGQIIQPLVEEARTHTSPSIERSVLLRMGFSSLEANPIVNRMVEKGLLGHGAGHLILTLAQQQGITVREAGHALLNGKYWETLPV